MKKKKASELFEYTPKFEGEIKGINKPKRWRAKNKCVYFTINFTIDYKVVKSQESSTCIFCNSRFKEGNYFRTKKEAEAALKKIKKVFLGEL